MLFVFFCVVWFSEAAFGDAPKRWKVEDFGGVLSVGLEGHRSFSEGRKHFASLCSKCHSFNGMPGGESVDLSRLALTYTPEELLGHVLDGRKHTIKPNGPIDFLSQAAVLDLLAFVLSGADAKSSFFFNP